MGSAHVCTRFSSLFDVPCVKINLTKSHITRKVGGGLTRKQTFNINELSFENWNTSKHVGHSRRMANFVSLSIKILISRFVVADLLAQQLLFSGTGQLQWKFPIYFSWFRCTKKMQRGWTGSEKMTYQTLQLHALYMLLAFGIQFIHLL